MMANWFDLRVSAAMDSPREPLADLAEMRRIMLRPRSVRPKLTDWQWEQLQQWERNFYSIALAKAARPCRKPDIRELVALAEKCSTRAEMIRSAQ